MVTGEEVEVIGQAVAVAGEAAEEEEDGAGAEVSEEDAAEVVTAAAEDGQETEVVDSGEAEEEDSIVEVIFMYYIFNYVQNTNIITRNLSFHCQGIDISNLFFGLSHGRLLPSLRCHHDRSYHFLSMKWQWTYGPTLLP